MSRTTKWSVGLLGIALWAVTFAFILFANNVTREPVVNVEQADGIVVFTGEGIRIKEAVRLLHARRGAKLLISGVNKKISEAQLTRLTGLTSDDFKCCVTLGYEAMDTLGNASETAAWASANNLDSLIVVTASYHMPRAMAELSLAMPDTILLPHNVLPPRFRRRSWWLNYDDSRVLISEFLKYLPSAVRLATQYVKPASAPNGAADTASSVN